MARTGKDYYRILGIPENADAAEVKKAYRRLAKKYHPDANPGNPAAAERFKDVGEANGVLSDPLKRKKYDQMRKLGAFGLGGRTSGATGGTSETSSFSFDDLGGFSEIFSSIFDRTRRDSGPKASRRPRKGRDVEYSVDVPFLTAAKGGKIVLAVPITEKCAKCKGSGGAAGAAWERCAECDASGTVSFGHGTFAVKRPCPACAGRGRRASSPCETCEGAGKLRQRRKFNIGIPVGVQTGSKVRIPGQGESGETGGAPGDLVVSFKVKPHPVFRREGADVHATVSVNLVQAMLGSKIRIDTVSGAAAELRIPPGTQPGTRFRLRGRGVRRNGQAGDHIVEVKIEVPESLTPEARKCVEQLGTLADMKR